MVMMTTGTNQAQEDMRAIQTYHLETIHLKLRVQIMIKFGIMMERHLKLKSIRHLGKPHGPI